jgi:hypothetical protein
MVHPGERVGVLSPKHLLSSFECLSLHRFCLVILSLAAQHRPKLANAGERVRVLSLK